MGFCFDRIQEKKIVTSIRIITDTHATAYIYSFAAPQDWLDLLVYKALQVLYYLYHSI